MIQTPDDAELDALCAEIAGGDDDRDSSDDRVWPQRKLAACARAGVYRWFVPPSAGGFGWSESDIARGYLRLSAADLTTTFILTQQVSALRRVASTANDWLRENVLPKLVSGDALSTVGISHLTTSRRHFNKPALQATAKGDGFIIDGYSPWVTGGCGADYLVMGAETDDQKQVLFAVPSRSDGIQIEPGFELMALTGSQTGVVRCNSVHLDEKYVIDGPVENVLSRGTGGGTGSLQTSTLAIGLAGAAVRFIGTEAERRDDLADTFVALSSQLKILEMNLLNLADGQQNCSGPAINAQDLRKEANTFVLRATQAALLAAKGAGYVKGHPVERWCREAMFFLVWSCPQPVLQSNLCQFAGIGS